MDKLSKLLIVDPDPSFRPSWESLQTNGPFSVASVCLVSLMPGYWVLNTFKGAQLYLTTQMPVAMPNSRFLLTSLGSQYLVNISDDVINFACQVL